MGPPAGCLGLCSTYRWHFVVLKLLRASSWPWFSIFALGNEHSSPYFWGKLPVCVRHQCRGNGCGRQRTLVHLGESGGAAMRAASGWAQCPGGSSQPCIPCWAAAQWCAPGCNHHPCHQIKLRALDPHLGVTSLLGPCSWVHSVCCFPGSPCDVSQAALWHQCCRADKRLSFCFICSAFDKLCPYLCFTLHCLPNSGLTNECSGKGTALIHRNDISFH